MSTTARSQESARAPLGSASTQREHDDHLDRVAPVTWFARACIVVWAGFWSWFALAHVFSGEPDDIAHALLFTIPILATTITAWIMPRVGGVFLVACGLFSLWYFDNTFTRLALALPAVGLGIVFWGLGAGIRISRRDS